MSERMAEEKLEALLYRLRGRGDSLNPSECVAVARELERAGTSEATLTAQLRARDEALRVARRHLKRARELELSAFGTDSETLAEVNTALAAIEEATRAT